jgi:hypothetical protein
LSEKMIGQVPAELLLTALFEEHDESGLIEKSNPRVSEDDPLLQRTLRQVHQERSRARRSRLLTAAAGVLVVSGVAGAAGMLLGRATAPDVAPMAAPTVSTALRTTPAPATAPARVLDGTDPGTGVRLVVQTRPAKGWTRLAVQITGAQPGRTCRVVAVARDGRRELAGSWVIGVPTPGQPAGFVDIAAAVAADDLASIELMDQDGDRLVSVRA